MASTNKYLSGRLCRLNAAWITATLFFSIFSAVIFVLTAQDCSASGKSFNHPEIEITYTLLPDGSAEVEEIRSFMFNGSFSWAQLEKSTHGKYGRYRIHYHGVRDASTGASLKFELFSDNWNESIKWYFSASNEKKRFLIRYRITGAVQRYGDVAQFYWKPIGDSHEPIGLVQINIIPPQRSEHLFKTFIHSRGKQGILKISDTRDKAVITQSRIPANTFLEIRVFLDPDIFPETPVIHGESHVSLLENEQAITEAWRLAEQRRIEHAVQRTKEIKNSFIITSIILVVFISLYIWFFIMFGREPSIDYDNEYERKPPRDLPPCVVPAILSQSKIDLSKMSRSFAATLLECARLGYIEISEKENKVLIFKNKSLIYSLTEKGALLLGNKEFEAGRDERRLIDFEKDVLEIVFHQAGDGKKVTSDEIEKWASKTSGQKTQYSKFIKNRAEKLREDFEKNHFMLDDQVSEKAKTGWIWISLTFGLIFIMNFFAGNRNPVYFVSGIVAILAGLLMSIPLARRSINATIEYRKWMAFRKFMSDFSAIKDAGPSLLPMWEHYLVYATALGISDKFLSNLKLVAEKYNASFPVAVWYHPAIGSQNIASSLDNLASLESLSSAISNLQNLSSALSSSSSGGGGFSGGGGGGGGGGGCSAG